MSEKKPEEFYILTQDGHLPFNVVRTEGEAAEICAMVRRSNNPDFIHVIEKQAYDKLQERFTELETENQKMKESLLKADWLHDHIFGKVKRVDWGKTFDINWAKINEALMSVSQSVAKFKNQKDEV